MNDLVTTSNDIPYTRHPYDMTGLGIFPMQQSGKAGRVRARPPSFALDWAGGRLTIDMQLSLSSCPSLCLSLIQHPAPLHYTISVASRPRRSHVNSSNSMLHVAGATL